MHMPPKMTGRRVVRSYVYLYMAARMHLDLAERQAEGSFYTSMACLMFSAFFLEAYVNHAGTKYVSKWPTIREEERRGKWGAWPKFKRLLLHCGLSSELSSPPFASYRELLAFRNTIAHGRTETLHYFGEPLPSDKLWGNFPKLEWEPFCRPGEARKFFEDAANCVRRLSYHLEPGCDPFMSATSGFFGTAPD